jgi:hypothetical protein
VLCWARDVEPDEERRVTNTKLVANALTSQDIGIRIFVPQVGYATVSNTASARTPSPTSRVQASSTRTARSQGAFPNRRPERRPIPARAGLGRPARV